MAFPASFIYIKTPEKCVGTTKKKNNNPEKTQVPVVFIKQKLWLVHIQIKNIFVILQKNGLSLTKMPLPLP